MSAEESKVIMRRFWSVWEEGDIDRLDGLLAPDYVNHTLASPDLPPGPEGVKEIVSMFRSGMPDLRVNIEDMIAEGDRVATRYALEGTHGGKIVEHWRVTDELDMMRQLGAIGEPEINPTSTEE